MHSILVLVASLVGGSQAGKAYIALPGMPPMYFENGKPAPPGDLWFHRLDLLRRVDGVSYFRLDDGATVKVRAANLDGPDCFVPVVESLEVEVLRKRYLGRRIWFFGGNVVYVESGLQGYGGPYIPFDMSLRIAGFDQVAPQTIPQSMHNRAT